ncbi:MAG: M48 family metallopeptidase [Hyphomicrobiaceae bacterium]|nr:MAG: M48 family metallopeptidase [Hyphomicrobiaceae bacterium]
MAWPRKWRAAAMAGIYAVSVCIASVSPAVAQGIPLIRDTEIENLLKDYSRPIFRAAGLGSQNISMRIVRHESFNAFVVDGRNVFINSGTLMQAKTPNEVIGVIAHETGHIKGGHLAALRARIARDQTKALLLAILGIGLMVGGAMSGGDSAREIGSAGSGVLTGGNELIMRSLLSERRAQESAADQAGLRYLEATKQSGRGMLETFERFAQQEFWSDKDLDPFVRSHPVAANRLAQLRENVAKSPYADQKDPPQLQLRHDLVRAKISGYLERMQTVLNRYPARDNSLPARYARAIARNCSGKCIQAMGEVDALIKDRPDHPYFWELKGNLYYWVGQYQESIPHLRKALQLAGGNEPLMQAELAQSMIATDNMALVDEAIALLRRSMLGDEFNAMAYHQLAKAFYKKQQFAQSELAAAQAHFIEGNVKQAQIFAKRAMAKLPRGSPEWIRAEDIVNYKEPT